MSLISSLCKVHEHVYRLTAYQCNECPTLVRESNETNSQVTGDCPESTQVLVVYYLLRELLKRQILLFRRQLHLSENKDQFLHNYVDYFDKFSTGVNLIKGSFTCLHWAWLKRGLPPEHTVHSTELLALQLWTDNILGKECKTEIQKEVEKYTSSVRRGKPVSISTMEDVKRLSLNLLMISDSRQQFYVQLIEETYLENMLAWYGTEKENYKKLVPEEYVHKCVLEVSRELKRATFFLDSSSYSKVKNALTNILLVEEENFLKLPVVEWLQSSYDGSKKYQKSLMDLFNFLGKGGWEECVFLNNLVITKCEEKLKGLQGSDSYYDVLSDINRKLKNVIDAFRDKESLVQFIHHGMFTALRHFLRGKFDEVLVSLLTNEIAKKNFLSPDEDNWASKLYKLYLESSENADDKDKYGTKKNTEYFNSLYKQELKLRLLKNAQLPTLEAKVDVLLRKEMKMLNNLFKKGSNFDFIYCCKRMVDDVYLRSTEYRECVSPIPVGNIIPNPVVISNCWNKPPTGEISEIQDPNVALFLTRFTEFYNKRFSGKILKFVPSYSTAELLFKNKGGTPKRILITLPLAALLIQFNGNKKIHMKNFNLPNISAEKWISTLVSDGILVADDKGYLTVGCTQNKNELIMLIGSGDLNDSISFGDPKEAPPSHRDINMLYDSYIVQEMKKLGRAPIQELLTIIEEKVKNLHLAFSNRDFKDSVERLVSKLFLYRVADSNMIAYM